LIRKWLAVGIILLFVGVTIAPSINFNTVKASTDDDLVEVTTQACGIQGYGDSTVKLTREQYQNLEEYLVAFRARLDQTSTSEEAIPIFKDAVVELDKYGLLPKGMSVERAQKFVTSGYQNQYSLQHLKKIYSKNSLNQTGVNNILCLVAGNTDYSLFIGPISMIGLCVYSIIFFPILIIGAIIPGLETLAEKMITALLHFFSLARFIPFEIMGFATFGGIGGFGPYSQSEPSCGWVYSLGLRGVQSINGSFNGAISGFPVFGDLGLIGFTGLVVGPKDISKNRFFLGAAYSVGLYSPI